MTRFLTLYSAAMVAIVFMAGAIAGLTPLQTVGQGVQKFAALVLTIRGMMGG